MTGGETVRFIVYTCRPYPVLGARCRPNAVIAFDSEPVGSVLSPERYTSKKRADETVPRPEMHVLLYSTSHLAGVGLHFTGANQSVVARCVHS